MSEASDAAIAKAKADIKKLNERVLGSNTDNEILLEARSSSRELRLIRGELEAIRILLSEGATPGVATTGFDTGNA